MSEPPFAIVDADVLLAPFSDLAIRVYALLRWRANDREGRPASPNVATLALELGRGERAIREAIEELRVAGVAERRRRFGGSSLTFVPRHPERIDVEALARLHADRAARKTKRRERAGSSRPRSGATAPVRATAKRRDRAGRTGATAPEGTRGPEPEDPRSSASLQTSGATAAGAAGRERAPTAHRELVQALAATLGDPHGRSDHGAYGQAAADLVEQHVAPDEMPGIVSAYRERFRDAELSPNAIAKWACLLRERRPPRSLATVKAEADELVGRIVSYARTAIEQGPLLEQATHGLPIAVGGLERLLDDARALAGEAW